MDSSTHQLTYQNTQEFHRKFYEVIRSENFEEFKSFIRNGANIYEILNCGDAMSVATGRKLISPFLTAIQYCASDQLPSFMLDIYEKDLELLKGTTYKRALVAMPEFQTEEFLKCCKFDVPMDESNFEAVLIKERLKKVDELSDSTSLKPEDSSNEPRELLFQPAKLAFLSKTDEMSSRFITQLEEIGPCDLNFMFPTNEVHGDCSFLRQAFRRSSHLKIARRLLKSPFVNEEMKSKDINYFCEDVLYRCDIWEFKEFFVDYKFNINNVYSAITYNSSRSFDFIVKTFMEQQNCTWKDLLREKFTNFVVGDKQTTLIHEIFKQFAQVRLDLTFDDDDLCVENDAGENCLNFLFNMYVNESVPMIEFIKKHPKLLTMRTNENFSIVHCAIAFGNLEILEGIIKMMDNKFNFLEDENAAVKCLHKDYKTYDIDHKMLYKILQTLMRENFDEFFKRNASKILIKTLEGTHSYEMVDFFLNLPIRFDLNEMHEGMNVYMAACESYDEKILRKIIDYQDVDDWNITGSCGKTLFMAACDYLYDDFELIKSIIKKQPDCVHKRTSDGSTTLFFVSKHPTPKIAQMIIDAGVDPKVTNSIGYTAILKAINNAEVFKVLLPFESDEDLRKQYFFEEKSTILENVEDVEVAKVLLTRNVDFNITRYGNTTPLFPYRSNELTSLYMEHIVANNLVVDVNIQNYDGNTALACGIMDENHEYFKKFVKCFKNEINFDICDGDGNDFTRAIMSISDYELADFLNTVKEEVLEEFLSRLKQDDEHDDRKYRPENVRILVEIFGLECLRENIKYVVNIEEIMMEIFQQFPDYLEVSDDVDGKITFFIEAVKNCSNAKSLEILFEKFGVKNMEICRSNLMEIIHSKRDKEFLDIFLKASIKK